MINQVAIIFGIRIAYRVSILFEKERIIYCHGWIFEMTMIEKLIIKWLALDFFKLYDTRVSFWIQGSNPMYEEKTIFCRIHGYKHNKK